MQKIINAPQAAVDEMVEGYLKAHRDLIEGTDNPRVLKLRQAPLPGKVGIVTGGGSGHKPAFIGYIGRNLVDAVAVIMGFFGYVTLVVVFVFYPIIEFTIVIEAFDFNQIFFNIINNFKHLYSFNDNNSSLLYKTSLFSNMFDVLLFSDK